ncbi:glutamic acid-rich protein isoform X3 [Lucilia sericata]|nr:glutamic acid-rich protein isoform X3 [Lucilia sericata]XP_037819384.1 glutamic acid-rich protein isoform X3 [Lucilia sericata]
MSSYATAKKSNQPSYVSLKLDQERALVSSKSDDTHNNVQDNEEEHEDDESNNSQGEEVQGRDLTNEEFDHDVEVSQQENSEEVHDDHDDVHEQDENKSSDQQNDDDVSKINSSHSQEQEEESEELVAKEKSLESYEIENTPEMPAVEVRLKEISQEVEKRNNEENRHIPSLTPDLDDIGRQSFLSLTDLIRTLHPNDKQIIPQIDSDYSNAMRVLGEKSVVVNTNEE